MRLDHTPPKGAGKGQGATKTEGLLRIIEGLGQDKHSFLPLGIRTNDLAKSASINANSIGTLLAPYIASGRIQVCKITVPGRPPQNEYRKGAGVAAPEFAPLKTRRGAGNLMARAAAAAIWPGLSTPRQGVADIVTPTLINTPQPEVGQARRTPAAGRAAHPPPAEPAVAAPATPKPAAGAALKKEPATRKALAGDEMRIGINDSGVLVIALNDDDGIELNPRQARRLGHFMVGTQGIWNPF